MPYLDTKRIVEVEEEGALETPGDLNYSFTKVALMYLEKNGTRYQRLNDIVGALECCKLEFYRRLAAPYEDTKIEENGDVY